MVILGRPVVSFKGVEPGERLPGCGIGGGPEAREQALFLVGRVARRRRAEIVQSGGKGVAVRR